MKMEWLHWRKNPRNKDNSAVKHIRSFISFILFNFKISYEAVNDTV